MRLHKESVAGMLYFQLLMSQRKVWTRKKLMQTQTNLITASSMLCWFGHAMWEAPSANSAAIVCAILLYSMAYDEYIYIGMCEPLVWTLTCSGFSMPMPQNTVLFIHQSFVRCQGRLQCAYLVLFTTGWFTSPGTCTLLLEIVFVEVCHMHSYIYIYTYIE